MTVHSKELTLFKTMQAKDRSERSGLFFLCIMLTTTKFFEKFS